jgi:glycosyltransferase involved in cell wall biosynthesis
MRILQVNSADTLGGGETHVLELTEALRQRGHDVQVAGRRGGPLKPDIALPFLNSADFITAIRLRRFIKRHRFDIVHAHVARDYPVAAAAVSGISEVKLVCTRHLLLSVRKNRFYKRVDGWIAPTSQILKTLAPLSPKTSAVIPNWVDATKFAFRPHPAHETKRLAVLGQISPHKGHDDAIEAMRILGEGYRLLIAGEGDERYLSGLKERARNLPVDFLGFVSLPDFFETVDVLAVPSWEEPFGIVLLEAMAAGIPVIATNRGGPLAIIPSALHGVLVPPRDPQALASAVRLLAADDRLRASMVKNARELVEKNFDIRSVVPRVEDFYRRVMMRS